MYKKLEPSPQLMQRARFQAGVLTSAQLREFCAPPGAARRWTDGWVRMGRGIYCVREPTFESWCWAGMLRAGDTGAITGAAAGHLHGFVVDPPSLITIYHQHCEPLVPLGDGAFRVRFRRAEREARGVPGRTSVERAIVDLAGESTRNQSIMAVVRAVADRMTTSGRIRDELAQTRQVRHRGVLETMCDEAANGVQSVLEWLFLTEVVRKHRLPEPKLQVWLVSGTRSDAFFEAHGFVAELDGRLGHADEPFRDLARDNRLAVKGILTLRFGWDDVVKRPCAVAAQIRELLQHRGSGDLGRGCARCRRPDR